MLGLRRGWPVKLGMQLALLLVPASQAGASVTVWATAATRKVGLADQPEVSNRIWSAAHQQITVHAAAGENEGFHLVLHADSARRDNLRVVASELRGDSGIIKASCIGLFRESYFTVPAASDIWGHPVLGSSGSVPDALIPAVDPYGSGQEVGMPFAVAAGQNQPVWVSIDIPRDTAAGAYLGTLTIVDDDAGQPQATITLRLTVWGFVLPAEPTLRTYYNIEGSTIAELHQVSQQQLDTLVDRYYQVLAERRLGAGYAMHKLPSYSNQSGFDWGGGVELFWSRWLDLEQMPTVGVVPIFLEDSYLIQQSNGQPYQVADLTPGSHFERQARLFFSRLWDDLSDRGWLDRAVVYLDDDHGVVSDEPYSEGAETYDRIRAWAEILHRPDETNPDKRLPLLVAGDSILPSAPYADLLGACDIWDMYMDEIDSNSGDYQARLAAHPQEQLWVVPNAYGDFIDYPAIYHRSLGWFAFKHGATGIEQWDVLAWYSSSEELVDPWVSENLTPVWGWGAGALLWPGTNVENRGIDLDGPVSSLRLELQRQSLEDAEYLHLLADLGLGELARGLAWGCLPGSLYGGLEIGTDQYERARFLAGSVLDSGGAAVAVVQGAVRDGNGTALAGAIVDNGTSAARTGADGRYRLTLLPGLHTLNVSSLDHVPGATTVALAASQTLTGIDLVLQPLTSSEEILFGSFEGDNDLWEYSEGATVQRSSAHVSHGSSAMRATFHESHADPAITTEEIAPDDWSQYDYLAIDIYNASPYLTQVELDLADGSWTYDFALFDLRPGEWSLLRLPVADIDLAVSQIVELTLYVEAGGKGDRDLFLDNMRLVRITGADTTAPQAPARLAARQRAAGVELAWSAPTHDVGGGSLTGLARYEISRADASGGPYELLNAHQEIVDPAYLDREQTADDGFYVVRAIDQAGNQSPVSAEARPGAAPAPRRVGARRAAE